MSHFHGKKLKSPRYRIEMLELSADYYSSSATPSDMV
jgi:hypothetical protein